VRTQQLRALLSAKRDDLLRETRTEIQKYREGENRQDVENALDSGDWSIIEHSDELNLRRLRSHRDVLIKIDDALRKLNENTYGVCEDCGVKINPERLKILPFAICCRDCQEKREEDEAATAEERQFM
jgi:DnaK suppressor protein